MTTWNLDPAHTSIDFAVRHMGISTVRGFFRKLEGSATTDDKGVLQSIEATIDAAGITTGEPNRDAHLCSPDFLNAEKYPKMTFKSTQIETTGERAYRVTGELTIRDQTKSVGFHVETTPTVKGPQGELHAGATAEGKLNRKDWGLNWNQMLEMGAMLVGEEVRFTLEAEAITEAPVAAS
jgi:polyisoprenoid-binding protein YceI